MNKYVTAVTLCKPTSGRRSGKQFGRQLAELLPDLGFFYFLVGRSSFLLELIIYNYSWVGRWFWKYDNRCSVERWSDDRQTKSSESRSTCPTVGLLHRRLGHSQIYRQKAEHCAIIMPDWSDDAYGRPTDRGLIVLMSHRQPQPHQVNNDLAVETLSINLDMSAFPNHGPACSLIESTMSIHVHC